jgi:hypothetical protein
MQGNEEPPGPAQVQSKSGMQQRALPVTSYKALKFRKRENIHYADIFGPVRPVAIGGLVGKLGLAHAGTGVIKAYNMQEK